MHATPDPKKPAPPSLPARAGALCLALGTLTFLVARGTTGCSADEARPAAIAKERDLPARTHAPPEGAQPKAPPPIPGKAAPQQPAAASKAPPAAPSKKSGPPPATTAAPPQPPQPPPSQGDLEGEEGQFFPGSKAAVFRPNKKAPPKKQAVSQ
jgi:hypothetical protein